MIKVDVVGKYIILAVKVCSYMGVKWYLGTYHEYGVIVSVTILLLEL